MLGADENRLLSSIEPGTPMGDLFCRYWHPVAAAAQLDERPTKAVRILGEDLVLYRDKSGTYGLIERFCPHRRVDLSYGIPEEHGLRCMYHGWMMDETGQCIEQPFEETVHPDGRFKEKVKVAGYPVQVYGGLVFAYMGPAPAPLLPHWEPYEWENTWSDIGVADLPCNWLQCMENSLDPVHLEWLHGYWGVWTQQQKAIALGLAEAETFPTIPKRHQKIGFDVFEHGMIKRRIVEGSDEFHHDWAIGHPILFPNVLFVGGTLNCHLQYRVPVDDTHTMHITKFFYPAAQGHAIPEQERVPYFDVPLYDPDGRLTSDLGNHQDFVAWITQGPNADRTKEMLGVSDIGVIMYRKLLKDQMRIVEDGGDPMAVVRDPALNDSIELPLERWQSMNSTERITTYWPAQLGESPEMVRDVERVLATWAGETPWVEATSR